MLRSLVFAVFLIMAVTLPAQAFMGLFRSGVETVRETDGEVVIDASSLKAGEARHYQWQGDGPAVRFMLVRDFSGMLRTALDACEVCWRYGKGYRREERAMLCIACGQRFALNRIGLVRGGCNPHPVASTAEGDTVRIKPGELAAGAAYFSSPGR